MQDLKLKSKIFITRSRDYEFTWTKIVLYSFMWSLLLAFERSGTYFDSLFKKSTHIIYFKA